MEPCISVIIPVYNTEKYVRKCLENVLSQSFNDFECILVDDCSSDNSSKICDEYAQADMRIKVIHKHSHEGAASARKTGIKSASAEYIQFIDSDDLIDTDMFKTMYQRAKEENLDMVICDIVKYLDNYGNKEYYKQELTTTSKEDIIESVVDGNKLHCSLCNKLIRKQLFDNIDWGEGSDGEDRYVMVQLIYFVNDISKIKCINKPYYHWIYNETSTTHREGYAIVRLQMRYKFHLWLVNFLIGKYDEKITLFEPTLSNFVNWTKHNIMVRKETRNPAIFNEMYPDSNQYFFNSSFKLPFYHKIFLYLASKKIIFQYSILDFARKILRKYIMIILLFYLAKINYN